MTLKQYYEWLKAHGIEDDDELLFVQDDGSGYTTEISADPCVQKFSEDEHVNYLEWENNPKWILGTGTA